MVVELIYGADALQPPLTGIGRYSYELARRLEHHPEIAGIRYFSMGQWLQDPIARLEAGMGQAARADGRAALAVSEPLGLSGRLRRHLSQSRFAVAAYHWLSPAVYAWRLRNSAHALFHAPNYFVPPFGGRAVSTVHDLSHVRYPQFHPRARVDYLNLALPVSLDRANHVITVSDATRSEFLAIFPGWSEDRVTAIPLAADPVFRPWPKEAVERSLREVRRTLPGHAAGDRKPGLAYGGYTLFVGTVEPRKNIDGLLDAYANLPDGLRREFPLVIAGSKGWGSALTHERIQRAVREGWLHYLAYVEQAHLPHLYAGAALFVYPSLYEGFGLPVVEAMAAGVPVITSSVSSMPEVAGPAARLVDPLRTDELRAAIEAALADLQWRLEARQAGLARAAGFSWDACAQGTVEVYRKVMER